MWIFGQASEKEIKAIKKQGWNIVKVDVKHFNLALDPNASKQKQMEIKEKMIAAYVGNDIFSQLTNWHEEEKAIEESKRKAELNDLRLVVAEKLWQESDELASVCVTDSVGWETDGDIWICSFTYEDSEPDVTNPESCRATFAVTFKANSDKAIDKGHVNW